MNAKKIEMNNEGYFNELDLDIQDLVSEMILDTINQTEGWKQREDLLEEIECQSRSGFTPFSHNKGGLIARQFTDLRQLWGSGNRVAHKGAQKEIERQIEYSQELSRESFFKDNEEILKLNGFKSAEHCNYHDLYDKNLGELAEELDQIESDNMSDDSSSIMFEVRFMYHGQDSSGKHHASVSCAVNTEGPYHRTSIPWAPSIFCEGAKEVEISWNTNKGLKLFLKRALDKTSKEVF